ncbi:MAG: transcriptional regulator with XRE-family HTH domain [Kiritimatiellia bacterium]
MTSPSEPLLVKLRQISAQRGLKTAALAQATGLDRSRVRKVLTGQEPMTVDELIAITQALELGPDEMAAMATEPAATATALPDAPAKPASIETVIDPYGNQPRQVFELAFALGCDFFFTANASDLTESHVPRSVLDQYKDGDLPIKLDAAYHQYNDPRYSDECVSLTLSFDALYECTFPWSSIKQVILFPAPPAPPKPKPEEEPEKAAAAPSFLRLVQ